jgi:hypothetical protein
MVASFLNGASAGSAPFVVEGSQVSDERFSFSTLQPRGVRVQIDSIRAQRADDCMAARGFTEPPVDAPVEAEEVRYAAAFGDAIIGDDATSDDAPAPTPVRMPDDIEETAVQKRADAQLPIANEHRLVVEAWIQVLEREATAAGL